MPCILNSRKSDDLIPQVIDPVELAKRIHSQLVELCHKDLNRDNLISAGAYLKSSEIVVNELKSMTSEAVDNPLKGGDKETP